MFNDLVKYFEMIVDFLRCDLLRFWLVPNEQKSIAKNLLGLKRPRRGALLLIIMVFIAVIGLGAMYAIPPIEKQGRSALESNYSTRLENFYRAFHDYQMIEDVDSTLSVAIPGPGPTIYTMSQIYSMLVNASEANRKLITDALMNKMISLGYITKRQRYEAIFPLTNSSITWEVELVPIY